MLGMPIVGLATTEMTTAVVRGVTGWVVFYSDSLDLRLAGCSGV
jgi:hypothetical protein